MRGAKLSGNKTLITVPSKISELSLNSSIHIAVVPCIKPRQADTGSKITGREKMQLTADEQWLMAYVNTRIHTWGDVKDGAIRAMKRIHNHQDFIDWVNCFLPTSRQEEIKRALVSFKGTKAPAAASKQIPIKLDERVVRLLLDRAKAENCSISELLIRRLAS